MTVIVFGLYYTADSSFLFAVVQTVVLTVLCV